jgi:hypothetical protein
MTAIILKCRWRKEVERNGLLLRYMMILFSYELYDKRFGPLEASK